MKDVFKVPSVIAVVEREHSGVKGLAFHLEERKGPD